MTKQRAHARWGTRLPLFFLAGCSHVAEAETQINAPPEAVWEILSDAPGFQDWNPVHVKIEGEFREGQKVRVHLREPDGEINTFDSNVTSVVPAREIRQGGGFPGIFTFSHSFVLEPRNDGTHLVQREEFRGLGVMFIDMDWTQEAYESVNAALKERVEARLNTD